MRKWLFLLIVLLGLTACSNQRVARLNNQANQTFMDGNYAEAVDTYRAAQLEAPDIPEPYYNSGNAYYRQNDYKNATLQAQQALHSAEEGLAGNTFYNLGNIYYNSKQYAAAVEAYKEALRIDHTDMDAKNNLELALRELERQQQNQQQQQQQPQDQQQQPNQDQQNQDQQQQQQNQQQQNQQQQSQQQSQPQQDQQQQQQNQQPQDQQPQQDQQTQQQPQDQQQQQEEQKATETKIEFNELTREQAEQLLNAIAEDTQTLQERLQQIFISPESLPSKDW